MTTQEFIGYYKMAKDKRAECEKRVKKQYIPFLEKITECLNISKATMEFRGKDGTETPIYLQNTPMRFLIFNMTLLKKYTDLEITDDLAAEYDLLNECGALETLLPCIPEKEFKEFNTLLSMSVDDYISNNRDLTAYIDRKFSGLTDSMIEQLSKQNTVEGEGVDG